MFTRFNIFGFIHILPTLASTHHNTILNNTIIALITPFKPQLLAWMLTIPVLTLIIFFQSSFTGSTFRYPPIPANIVISASIKLFFPILFVAGTRLAHLSLLPFYPLFIDSSSSL